MKRLLWTIQRFPGDVWDGVRNADPIVHLVVLGAAASMFILALFSR